MCSNQDQHIKVLGSSMSVSARRCGIETQKPHISILPVVTASGALLACLIIEGASNPNRIPHLPEGYFQSSDKRFHFAASSSGFIEKDIFDQFIIHTVIPAINRHREMEGLLGKEFFLMLDGHAAHHSVDAIREMKNHNIFVGFFPPHTSHILQPLDRGVFHVFKRAAAKALFIFHTLCGVPNLADRIDLIMKEWNENVTEKVIRKSFKHAGIYPLSYERALASMSASGRYKPEYAPPELVEEATARMMYGDDAPHVLSLQQHVLENGGVYTVTVETRKCNKITGVPYEMSTRTCLIRGGEKVMQYSYDIKQALLSSVDEQRRRKKRKINSTIGRFSNSPGYEAAILNDRKERAIKSLALKVLMPILDNLVKDAQFREANPTFNLSSDEFKKLKAMEKKEFLIPLISEDCFEKYFQQADEDSTDE